jgi:hypothetical protein
MPSELDGLKVDSRLLDRPLELRYRIGSAGCGVTAVSLNGQALAFDSSSNVYRRGGARLSWSLLRERLDADKNVLDVTIG